MNGRSIVAGSLVFFASIGAARADLPPPDGSKFVDFEFAVDGLGAYPDHVLIAYPYSTSNGAPTVEHAVVAEGKALSVGRRSPPVKLYAIKRSDYDEWKKGYRPPQERSEDPELEKLFTSAKVSQCNLAPQPNFVLPTSDARSTIRETLKLTSASPCTLVAAAASGATVPAADVAPAPSSPSSPPSETPKRAGCGSCVVGAPSSAPWAAGAWLAALLALVSLRRRGR